MSDFETRWCFVHDTHVYDDDARCDTGLAEDVDRDRLERVDCGIVDVVVIRKDLPPSIVVDGRVVAVAEGGDDDYFADWVTDACELAGISLMAFGTVFDAAREVAE